MNKFIKIVETTASESVFSLYLMWSKILTVFGDIYCAFDLPKVKAKQIREAIDIIQPGDIILRRYIYYLDGYFIKKYKYTHSGMLITKETIVHSIAEGVEYIDTIDFIKDCDGFMILRPGYKEGDIEIVIDKSISLIGVPYDFSFKTGTEALYCHEATNEALKAVKLDVQSIEIKFWLVKKRVIIDKCFIDKFSPVYETE